MEEVNKKKHAIAVQLDATKALRHVFCFLSRLFESLKAGRFHNIDSTTSARHPKKRLPYPWVVLLDLLDSF